MSGDSKDIIDLKKEPADSGELKYAYDPKNSKPSGDLSVFIRKVFGIAIVAGILFLLTIFFVYVALPVILALILYAILKNIFKPHR